MKKIPLVFSGCLLGLGGAGNLLADSLPLLGHAFSLTGLLLWFFFLVYHVIRWQESKRELQQPALLSGMATFPMAGMILSTYLFRLFPAFGGLSQLVWWFAFLLDLCLILYFTKTHVMARPRAKATPSWTVDLSGGRSDGASLSYPGVWLYFDLVSVPAYLSGFEKQSLTEPLIGTRRNLLCSLFSSFSCPGSCGWSKPSYLDLTDHGGGLARVLFLCFDAPP